MDLIERFTVIDGRRLAYPDSGGAGPTVLALHGHFSRGRAFAPLAQALSGRWRAGKSEAAALRFPAHPRCNRPVPKAAHRLPPPAPVDLGAAGAPSPGPPLLPARDRTRRATTRISGGLCAHGRRYRPRSPALC
ncbi:hypothetical protein GCM10009605_02510 [Nocardiopsis composta]